MRWCAIGRVGRPYGDAGGSAIDPRRRRNRGLGAVQYGWGQIMRPTAGRRWVIFGVGFYLDQEAP